jgi:hypothetical protein
MKILEIFMLVYCITLPYNIAAHPNSQLLQRVLYGAGFATGAIGTLIITAKEPKANDIHEQKNSKINSDSNIENNVPKH